MDDLRKKLEKLITDAAECDMIASLAADTDKRQAFRALAVQYRKMADAIRQVVAERGSIPSLELQSRPVGGRDSIASLRQEPMPDQFVIATSPDLT